MRDFARYVILSPVMSATIAPAIARTIPLNQSGTSFRDAGTFDPNGTLGVDGRSPVPEAEELGSVVRPRHLAS